ncbi:MAG: tetratricopeptide repeat protein [Saprospiraceae bacterium]|nr:tetratricopeptide repeat protein [Saprospiraceae bacterium]
MSRLEQLFNLLQEQPSEPFLLFAIAKEYEKAKDDTKALEFYIKLTETTPQYVGTYYHLGKLYERIGQADTAFQTYKTGMSIAKQEGDMHAYSELNGAKMSIDDDDDDF